MGAATLPVFKSALHRAGAGFDSQALRQPSLTPVFLRELRLGTRRWTGWPLIGVAFSPRAARLSERRAMRGGVADFLNAGVGPLRTDLNVADMAILLGVAIVVRAELGF